MMENKDAEQYLKDLATQLFVMTREDSEDVDCANCEKVLGDGDDVACSYAELCLWGRQFFESTPPANVTASALIDPRVWAAWDKCQRTLGKDGGLWAGVVQCLALAKVQNSRIYWVDYDAVSERWAYRRYMPSPETRKVGGVLVPGINATWCRTLTKVQLVAEVRAGGVGGYVVVYNGVNHFERGQVSTSLGTGLGIPWTDDDDSDSGVWLAEVQLHEEKDNGGVRHRVKYTRGGETEVLDLDGNVPGATAVVV